MSMALTFILGGCLFLKVKYIFVPLLVLRIVEYYCVRCIAVSSIAMAPGYLTDRFALNNGVHDWHTCNCTNIPIKK